MRRIFLDPERQKAFELEGYVKIPLLNETEIAWFQRAHSSINKPDLNHTFYTSHWSLDIDYRREINDLLKDRLSQKALPLFDDYKSVYSYFLVKHSSKESEVTLHQDWTLVDEENYCGVTIWCPLVDITPEMGPFNVVPKSHQFINCIRGSGIDPPYKDIGRFVEKNFLSEVLVKAGEAIAFDQRILHYSPPNRSDGSRVVLGHVVIPAETSLIHFAKRGFVITDPSKDLDTLEEKPSESNLNHIVERFDGNDDMLLNFAFGDIPSEKLHKSGEKVCEVNQMTREEFADLFRKFNPKSEVTV